MIKKCIFLLLLSSNLYAGNVIQTLIDKHYKDYSKREFFTAIQVSIKTPGGIKTYVTGRVTHDKNSPQINKSHLFTIGSITKSFTASLMLMAQRDKKLSLSDTLGSYLKQYPHWKNIKLSSLLNMSSGLPNYSDAPTINYTFSSNLEKGWTQAGLINLVYSKDFNPPLKSGYFYTNTGYILSELILEQLYKSSFKQLLTNKIIKPLALKNTFYPLPTLQVGIKSRMVHGYGYNIYDNPELLGRDVTDNNLTWAASAGGIVANSEDVIHWVEALFSDDALLAKNEQAELRQLVSVKTGKPIKQTSPNDTRGFGLGVIQNYDSKIGRFWFYQGETLGYRALYLYKPCNNVIISALFNSAVNGDNDNAGKLMMGLYKAVLDDLPELNCKALAQS